MLESPRPMREILIATSNAGKLRDFAAAARKYDVRVAPVPVIDTLPPAREDAPTFEANACKKAEHYSRYVKGHYVEFRRVLFRSPTRSAPPGSSAASRSPATAVPSFVFAAPWKATFCTRPAGPGALVTTRCSMWRQSAIRWQSSRRKKKPRSATAARHSANFFTGSPNNPKKRSLRLRPHAEFGLARQR